MVKVSFSHQGREVLALTVAYGQPVQKTGDSSWLDFDHFEPGSDRLGRPVSWAEDCEEWARSLPAAYAGTPIQVRVLADTAVQPSPPTKARDVTRRRWPWLAGGVLLLAAATAAALALAGQAQHRAHERRVAAEVRAELAALPAGPATTPVPLSATATARQLTTAQLAALSKPLNAFVAVHNQWAARCVPLTSGRAPDATVSACTLPQLAQMNTLLNQERTAVRQVEAGLAAGGCRSALAGLDMQLYEFHTGATQEATGLAGGGPSEVPLGLRTMLAAGDAISASTKSAVPSGCAAG